MKIHVIHAGLFKLDGGAMFGVVPRVMWEKVNPPDAQNLCTWAMRCLLIDTGDRRVLIDTGMGDKQDEKFRSHFHPHGGQTLMGSLREAGFKPEDITDVLLTHFHFDHVGGAINQLEDGSLVPAFPKATYWSNEKHFHWAEFPNDREKASFLKENFIPLRQHGILRFMPTDSEEYEWLPGIRLRFVFGHTEAMMIPYIDLGGRTLVFCADVIPSAFHIRMPWVMAYDVRPLRTLKEKERLLREALAAGQVLFFEHDPHSECATLKKDARGRITVDKTFALSQIASIA